MYPMIFWWPDKILHLVNADETHILKILIEGNWLQLKVTVKLSLCINGGGRGRNKLFFFFLRSLIFNSCIEWSGLPWWLIGKEYLPMQEMWVWSLGWEDPLEKEMAIHSSIVAWKILQTEEPGGATVRGVAKSRTRLSNFTNPPSTGIVSRFLNNWTQKAFNVCPGAELSPGPEPICDPWHRAHSTGLAWLISLLIPPLESSMTSLKQVLVWSFRAWQRQAKLAWHLFLYSPWSNCLFFYIIFSIYFYSGLPWVFMAV